MFLFSSDEAGTLKPEKRQVSTTLHSTDISSAMSDILRTVGQPLVNTGEDVSNVLASSPITRATAAKLREGMAQFPALRGIVDIYESEAGLPADLRDAIEAVRISRAFHGVYDSETGRIFLMAGNIPTSKAMQATFIQHLLRHEGRHAGLDILLGGREIRTDFMIRAARVIPWEVYHWLERHGMDSTYENQAEAAEEILVSWPKTNTAARIVDKFLAKVAIRMRSIFPSLLLTKSELRQLLAAADDFVDGQLLDCITPLGLSLTTSRRTLEE